MGPATKRDRWASSSEEDEKEQAPVAKKKAEKKKQALETPKTDASISARNNKKPHFPLHNPLLQGCRSVYDTYERLERISEGTYGVVWKARDFATNEIVALKQIKFHATTSEASSYTTTNATWKEGFPVTALREINVLMALSQHENIVSVREMVVGSINKSNNNGIMDKVFMVMEFLDCDLKDALRRGASSGPLAQSELKGILQQILAGTQYMHSKWHLHRDLKPSNILVKMSTTDSSAKSGGGRIALADFGLARKYQDPAVAMTLPVVTLWYRAPELLFGQARYGPAVDMWSIGCIMGELIQSGGSSSSISAMQKIQQIHTNGHNDDEDEEEDCNAIMKGQGELDQINQIFSFVGTPNETTWPDFDKLPNSGLLRWKTVPDADILLPKQFRAAGVVATTSSTQTFLDSNGYNLLKQMLMLDPAQRITADQAVAHPYFTEGVAPQLPHFFTSTT